MHEMEMRLLDLFSGIGGFSYAAEKLVGGYKTVAFCEMDEFCQKVLQKHWPEIPIYDDVRTLDATRLGRIDIVTGGYPCQPFSQAGKRQGEKDERHLWPEMLRIIKSCKPRYVVAENVAGHVNMGLDQVLTDLENQGYTTRPIIIPACAKNAPHRRDRVWIIGELMADTSSLRGQNISGNNKKFATRSAKNENVEFSNSCSSDRGSELMADTKIKSFNESDNDIKSSKQKQGKFRGESSKDIVADTKNVRWEQTEWQGWESSRRGSQDIDGSETEREEAIATDVPNTKRRIGETQLQWQQRILRKQNSKRQTTRFSNGNLSDRGSGSTERRMGYMANGISEALSGHFSEEPKDIPRVTQNQKDRTKKLKALGNSIVPQVAAELFYAIRIAEYGE